MNTIQFCIWALIALLAGKLVARLYAYFFFIGEPYKVVYLRSQSTIYHKSECPILKGDMRKITLLKAYHSKYESCKVCCPDVLLKKAKITNN